MIQSLVTSLITVALIALSFLSGPINRATAAELQLANKANPVDQHSASSRGWLGPKRLATKYQSMRYELHDQPIEDSFNLQAHVLDEQTSGDVYAVMPYAFKFLTTTLSEPGQVCQAIVLHINVKGCVTDTGNSEHPIITLYVGKKEYQNPKKAIKVQYEFSVPEHSNQYTLVGMTADKGPLNTENIFIYIEFTPVGANESFVHFLYSADYGSLARFALNTYLATLGRHKVGFSTVGIDQHGEPVYIKGIQGVVERNTMRYFFALHSYFSTLNQPKIQRFDASLNRWFDYVEKYPRQLLEVPRDEYLESKHKERLDVDRLTSASVNTF